MWKEYYKGLQIIIKVTQRTKKVVQITRKKAERQKGRTTLHTL